LAARLMVGLVRGGYLGGPGAILRIKASTSHLHRRPRMLTLGPSAWAMAHCTLISRSIQRHDDRLGGRPAANSMPRPRGCCTHPAPLFAVQSHCRLTPPGTMQDATAHPVGDAPGQQPPTCALSFVCHKGGCVKCWPSPHCGAGVWRVLDRPFLDPSKTRWLLF
jgi:hypothetical protein